MSFCQRVFDPVGRLADHLSGEEVPLSFSAAAFIAAVALRTGLERFSDNSVIPVIRFVHYAAFYASIACWLVVVLRATAGEKILRAAKIVLPGFIVLLTAPTLDLFLSGGKGYNISYLWPGKHDLLTSFFTFAGPFDEYGVSIGMQIEIGLVLVGLFALTVARTGSLPKAVLTAVLTYAVIFAHGALPFAMQWFFGALEIEYSYSDTIAALWFVSFALPVLGTLWCVQTKEAARLSYGPMLHYVLVYAVGLIIGLKERESVFHGVDVLEHLLRPVALFVAVAGASRREPAGLSWPFLALALGLAALVDFTAVFAVLIVAGACLWEGCPPWNLGRVFFLGKPVLGIATGAALFFGYRAADGNYETMPGAVMVYAALTAAIGANVRDLERSDPGRLTLPGLLGVRWAPLALGGALLAAITAGAHWFLPFSNAVWVGLVVGLVYASALHLGRLGLFWALHSAALISLGLYAHFWAPVSIFRRLL